MADVCNYKTATLVLRTADAASNASKTSTLWANIDMTQVLGDMYTKYDYFNIVLQNVLQASGANINAGNDLMPLVYMSGLNFRNQHYQSSLNYIGYSAYVGSFVTQTTTVNSVYPLQNSPICTFSTSDNTNITISLTTIGGAPTSTYPNYIYVFQIFGVYDK